MASEKSVISNISNTSNISSISNILALPLFYIRDAVYTIDLHGPVLAHIAESCLPAKHARTMSLRDFLVVLDDERDHIRNHSLQGAV